ncbi:patatin-like phospholipase family protein [Paenisporosarcina sp. TG-14]|uniref:patatin-like phospholipase family protein n=1 Tax=Paenisporosarcina sp. TG-14 TaxID=1231057 RepID=UPI000377B0A7
MKEGISMKSGLILEGGGMRGVYTSGVLECFLENGLFPDYVIGVSAGACNAASYISRQLGRNHQVTIGYVNHPDYISIKNLILKRELFGMNLIFNEIPNTLVPFDFARFTQSPEEFVIGATNCLTGEPVYFNKSTSSKDILTIIRASSSLPFMARAIDYQGSLLMDGGISDPIPIHKALADCVDKPIIVLTKEKGYRKAKSSLTKFTSYFYRDYKGLVNTLENRYQLYNDTLDFIEKLEEEKKAIIIRPSKAFNIGRIERNPEKLTMLYNQGYNDAMANLPYLTDWLGIPNVNQEVVM